MSTMADRQQEIERYGVPMNIQIRPATPAYAEEMAKAIILKLSDLGGDIPMDGGECPADSRPHQVLGHEAHDKQHQQAEEVELLLRFQEHSEHLAVGPEIKIEDFRLGTSATDPLTSGQGSGLAQDVFADEHEST